MTNDFGDWIDQILRFGQLLYTLGSSLNFYIYKLLIYFENNQLNENTELLDKSKRDVEATTTVEN